MVLFYMLHDVLYNRQYWRLTFLLDSLQVAQVHARFVSAIEKLFESYRGVTGHGDIDLRIIWVIFS